MRQALMHQPGTIEIREVPDLQADALKENEILIQIRKIGICGSDIHVYHGEHPATPYPVVQGHEYSAQVVAHGEKVLKVKKGDKVTARPQLTCGKCGPCLRGQYNACQELKVQGFQAWGVAQDLFIVPEDRVVKLPDHMTFEEGALVEPAAVGAHSTRRASSLLGKNVVVSGAGTIGNFVAQFAKARGAKKVILTDINQFKLDKAKECGLEFSINLTQESFVEGIQRILGKEGFQVGFEAAGVQQSLDVLIQNLEKGGEIVILGVYAKNPTVNMFYLGEHELNVFGSMMYRQEDYEEAVEWIDKKAIITQALISKQFPFEAYKEAYQYIEQHSHQVMKVMIDLEKQTVGS